MSSSSSRRIASDPLTRRSFLKRSGQSAVYGAFSVGLLAACSDPSEDEDLTPADTANDENGLVEAAREEGTLSIYTGFTAEDNRAAAGLFYAAYGIELEIYRANTGQVLQRFELEARAGDVGADVLGLADIGATETIANDGLLMEYEPESTKEEGFAEEFKFPFYNVVGLTVWPMAWNTDEVTGDQVPTSYEDFLDPFWAGRLGMLDAATSRVGLQYYYIVREAMGIDFMRELGSQEFRFVSPNNAIAEQILSSELYGAPVITANVVEQFVEQEAPIASDYASEATPVLSRTISITADPPHPNGARLFVDFMLSQAGQSGFQQTARAMSPRTDVEIQGVPVLGEFEAAQIDDMEEFDSRQEELEREFNEFFKS